MAANIPITDNFEKVLLVWRKPISENISFFFNVLFTHLLALNQYVCKAITTTDIFLLIIPRTDLQDLLNDPVYKFPQVKIIYVYYDNNKSFDQDQVYYQSRYIKLRFCHERDIAKELDKPKINNAIHPSRSIDRTAINSFASSVTQRVSAKRPPTTGRHQTAQQWCNSTLLHGFSVKNIEQIDQRFICPICQLIFREPCQLICGHRTCQSCMNVENDKMSCLTCSEISSSKNIWPDKGFRREMEQLLIHCAICDWTEMLKLYQEHIEQDHREHVNVDEVHQQHQSNVLPSLCSTHVFSNNNQRQNPLSQIRNDITLLSNNVNMLNNDQQRIRDELCCDQRLLRVVSKELSSLKSSAEDHVIIVNGMTIINDFSRQEIWSLKQMMENRMATSFDGTFLWKITCAEEKIVDAQSERRRSIYSPAFYSSRTGYKMCMRLFLNGDGDTRDKYLSLFFVIIKGGYDPILQWPFLYKVTFSLIDQSTLDNNQRNINKSFWPDPTLSCFKRPVYSMNEAYGIKKFFPIELLNRHRNLYIQDGVMFIKIVADFSAERPATSGTGATPNDEYHVDTIDENNLHIS